ncbi:MAG TPA: hypothetical protein VGR22_07640 [Thermomicrobiales bacterium]|nr:hypothetical protein [Thermomicrobiales bacterium]
MTDMAVRDIEARRASLLGSLRNLLLAVFGRESDHGLPLGIKHRQDRTFGSAMRPVDRPTPRVVQEQQLATPPPSGEHRWERHPQLRSRQAGPVPTGSTRSVRLEAERGLILARAGKLVEAVEAFTVAAGDPEIDLAALPGFWDLPRNGMLTAVRAYERAERLRDAATLEARIRHLLKPRSVRTTPATRPGRLAASGD